MRYAVIQNNLVANIILLENPEEYTTDDLLIPSNTANIGDTWDGVNFITAVPIPPPPDWGAFNREMLLNTGYNRISAQTINQRAVTRLETLLSPTGYMGGLSASDYPILKALWDEATTGLPLLGKPTATEIASWNAIALQNNMPFSFDTNGKLVLS
ncbi:hypothetical protein Ava_D0001 [Trichormus variabilis ATCC 29413]|uniref:Uncharacterized protein n=2 Tax=Anabaena variabilis TaxID=264691 RepID=Q3M2X0_TRIV2|nr:hypothetical protein [Trichormus variabilis]ABA24666.1 hypothetical protein Ava_D0001 [Trichormus variabilis ATCC 29413]MBC1217761.1 hypothetical protein [Trichormus variabilis ARAD]MBC1259008.1 hypothetical protein [Trichormus variabilis V5]MBC1302719.1 hypothetical protein [Trichormus variabilis N2B]MBC1324574.1 hypothetical protein [Trichormus variabilis 9RC]